MGQKRPGFSTLLVCGKPSLGAGQFGGGAPDPAPPGGSFLGLLRPLQRRLFAKRPGRPGGRPAAPGQTASGYSFRSTAGSRRSCSVADIGGRGTGADGAEPPATGWGRTFIPGH